MEKTLLGIALAAVIGMIGYLIKWVVNVNEKDKKLLMVAIDNVNGTIVAHVHDCNKIPKRLLLEKIENICEKQDLYQDVNSKSFENITVKFDKIDNKFDKMDDKMERLRDRSKDI